MRRGILILSMACLMIVLPRASRAETRVYVSFSVGGAVVVGAGVLYWSFSYASQVGERRPSEERPDPLSLTTAASESDPLRAIRFMPQLMPQHLLPEARTRDAFTPPLDGLHAAPSVELPLLVFRW